MNSRQSYNQSMMYENEEDVLKLRMKIEQQSEKIKLFAKAKLKFLD